VITGVLARAPTDEQIMIEGSRRNRMNETTMIAEGKRKILAMALTRFSLGLIVMGALFFLSAGTIRYLNGWLFILGLTAPMIFTLVYFYRNDPAFLEKRMRTKEKEGTQRKYLMLSLPLYLIALVTPGLDYRFGWSHTPLWLSLAALAAMIGGYLMFVLVMNENRYASRVVEIQEGQKLIDTGLYSVVRHPMYLAMIVLYLSASLVLGSYYSLIPMAIFLSTLVIRITNEEKVLLAGLPGYADYAKRVRYRLIPLVW
jgi:protein-S-isoprenylcysteine O-methyltransferase Ste14